MASSKLWGERTTLQVPVQAFHFLVPLQVSFKRVSFFTGKILSLNMRHPCTTGVFTHSVKLSKTLFFFQFDIFSLNQQH